MRRIDLNADMGESFGAWQMGRDAELMTYVSSINIACGFHAGDPSVLRRTIENGILAGVKIGAHPSFPDLQGFGRREMKLSADEVFDTVLYQVAAVKGVCEAFGKQLHHVKPHGALYNMAARDRLLAGSIVKAVERIDPDLVLYGLSGSHLISEAEAAGLVAASEVFADRTYRSDGSLTPRSEPDALIADGSESIDQVLSMIVNGTVTSTTGETVQIRADTVCIHGDGPHAVEFAARIREALSRMNIEVG